MAEVHNNRQHEVTLSISPRSAAITACEEGQWSLTNLQLQKLLYFAHRAYLGRHGDPLVNEPFEAWDLGPVIPSLYFRLRQFGAGLITDLGNVRRDLARPEHGVVREIVRHFHGTSAGKLVELTHETGGAWARNYIQGIRGIVIPNADILADYARENRRPVRQA